MGALVRGAVRILHGEFAAAVADAQKRALELGIALLGLPDIHLAHPVDLTVPGAQRIDAEGLGQLRVAGFLLVADSGEEAREVEVQAVVVLRPARSLEGDEFRTVRGLDFEPLVDGVGGVVLGEAGTRVQLDGHLPDIVVDTAGAEAEGMVIALHVVQVQTAQVAGVHGGMAPEQEAAAILVPFTDGRCRRLDGGRDVPDIGLADTLQVTQPEQDTVRSQVAGGSDGREGKEDGGRIGVMQPQPGGSLVVVAVRNEFLGRRIDAQEADGGLSDPERRTGCQGGTLAVDGSQGHGPGLAVHHVGNRVTGGAAREGLIDRPGPGRGAKSDRGGIRSRIPLHEGVITAHLVELAHGDAGDAGGTGAGVLLHHADRVVRPVRTLEHVLERNVGRHVLVGITGSVHDHVGGQGAVAVSDHPHLLRLGRPTPDIIVPAEGAGDRGGIRSPEDGFGPQDFLVLAGAQHEGGAEDQEEFIERFHIGRH